MLIMVDGVMCCRACCKEINKWDFMLNKCGNCGVSHSAKDYESMEKWLLSEGRLLVTYIGKNEKRYDFR